MVLTVQTFKLRRFSVLATEDEASTHLIFCTIKSIDCLNVLLQ